jgi:hypothetical protein
VLIAARYLVDRARHPRSRADELRALRTRLVELPGCADAVERELAGELRDLRARVTEALGRVDACGQCTAGHPLPASQWSGGHCCSTNTADVFTEDELAALSAAGTRPGHLRPPRSEHAGCIFRGPAGCSLDAAHRPTVCSRYMCGDLRAELHARGDLLDLVALVDRMDEVYGAFLAARAARREREELAEIERALTCE